MSSETTNLHLVKPTSADTADIGIINGNMDIIDAAFPQIRAGSVATGALTASTVKTVEVAFSSPLPSIPYVVLTPATGVTDFLQYVKLGVSYVSETGFTLNAYSSAAISAGRNVHYIAVCQ